MYTLVFILATLMRNNVDSSKPYSELMALPTLKVFGLCL